MTDRYHSITLVLKQDVREDDAEQLMTLLKNLKGVLSVEGNIADITSTIAITRVRREIGKKLWDVLYGDDG